MRPTRRCSCSVKTPGRLPARCWPWMAGGGLRESDAEARMVVLGIDIGGTHIKAGMVDEQGAILASRTLQTPADLDGLMPSLQEAIDWLLEATATPSGV